MTSAMEDGGDYNIMLSHFWPSSNVIHTQVLEPMRQRLADESDGRVNLEIYTTGQLGNADEQYSIASSGTADIALGVHGYTAGKFPLTSVSDLPFVFSSSEEGSQILQQLYDEFPDLQEEHGETVPLWFFTGELNQLLSNKEIKSLEDLKGLKVRSPSLMMNKVLEELGAIPVSMSVTDIYESLSKGVIDAAMAGLSTVNEMKLDEVVDYITIVNISSSSMFVTMNKNVYENIMNESDKELLLDLVKDSPRLSGEVFDLSSKEGLEKANIEGIQIYELPEEELRRWEEITQPIIDNWIDDMNSQNLPGQEVYNRLIELTEN
ncbi:MULTISPECIES: TRAP transporter substrate-binding protein [Peribacillus]|uniref:TRAP transporter substrate-binding protein n=1 Tax=Peribacillus TaxID=2675229 RepID=UPI001F4E6588|nr:MULTISPECIES: TRAP transporter substrate-binding protein [unclassified Peribacillus]MCK1983593.1 TRAP transporter substrate-binding protein [Peribacillus sp. Aquil_B1]MCK2006611.1 TRAP transporter substrate-binding protein [Peribacillus sp. Aquil_B8]